MSYRHLFIMCSDSKLEKWINLNMTNVYFTLMIIDFFYLFLVIHNSTSVYLDIVFRHILLLEPLLLLSYAFLAHL